MQNSANRSLSKSNKIVWFPTDNSSRASSRIHIYNINCELQRLGYHSMVLHRPESYIQEIPITEKIARDLFEEGDIVVIQKFHSPRTEKLIKYLKSIKVKVVYNDCDLPMNSNVISLVDQVVVPSNAYKSKIEAVNKNVFSIPDAPEKHEIKSDFNNKGKLKCVWFGASDGKKWNEVTFIQELIFNEFPEQWELITISDHEMADIQWEIGTLNRLVEFDLVVIPLPDMDERYKMKSSNRLLQSMSQGMPVLASPLPSYLDICNEWHLDHLICHTKEDWINHLQYYSSLENRRGASQRNIHVASHYQIRNIALKWCEYLNIGESFKRTNGSMNIDEYLVKRMDQIAIQWKQKKFNFKKYFINLKSLYLLGIYILKSIFR